MINYIITMFIAQVLTATGQQVFSVLRWPTSWRHHNYTPLSKFQCVAYQSYVTQSSVTVKTAWDVDTGLAKCFNQWSSPVNQHWTSSSVGSHCPNKHRAMCPDLPFLIVINRLGKKKSTLMHWSVWLRCWLNLKTTFSQLLLFSCMGSVGCIYTCRLLTTNNQ